MRTLPGWLTIRTAICHAPVYQQEPGDSRGMCMLCNILVGTHPRELRTGEMARGLHDGVSWYRLEDRERDEWSDVLEILTT